MKSKVWQSTKKDLKHSARYHCTLTEGNFLLENGISGQQGDCRPCLIPGQWLIYTPNGLGVTNVITMRVVPNPEIRLPPNNFFCNCNTKPITAPTTNFDFVRLYVVGRHG